MNTLKIMVRSPGRTLLLILFLTIVFFIIAGLTYRYMIDLQRLLVSICYAVIAHFAIRKLTTAKTEWTFSETGLTIKWVTNYYGTKNKDIQILWTEVKDYRRVYGDGYCLFRIYLVNGEKIVFGYSGWFIEDDSNKLSDQFRELFLKTNNPIQWKREYGERSNIV